MIPILISLTTATAPIIVPKPVCFATEIEAALYIGEGWGGALVFVADINDGSVRLTFVGANSWTEVQGRPGNYCITDNGKAL